MPKGYRADGKRSPLLSRCLSPEARQKLKGRHPSEETKRKISQSELGKFVSEETRARIGRSKLGRRLTEAHKAKIGLAHLGTRHKGWHLSEEIKRKLSLLWTKERREEKRKLILGTHHSTSEVTKRKISSALMGNTNFLGQTHSEETRQKISETAEIRLTRPENHPNWQGGIGNDPYPFDFNQRLKEEIKTRDNYICQLCGMPEAECLQSLCCHHIDYNKGNIDKENLISLCHRCNFRVNYNRNRWQKYFVSILKRRKDYAKR